MIPFNWSTEVNFQVSIPFREDPVTYSFCGKGGWVWTEAFIQVSTLFCRWNMVSVLCHYILCEVLKIEVYCVKYRELRDLLLFVNLFYLRLFNRDKNVLEITSKFHIRLLFRIKKPTCKSASLCILSCFWELLNTEFIYMYTYMHTVYIHW